jgi:hypothetical protein
MQNPCRLNQRVLVDTRLCASANEILAIKIQEEEDGEGKHVPEEEEEEVSWGNPATQRERARAQRAAYRRAVNELKAATATTLLSLLECIDQVLVFVLLYQDSK